MLVDVAVLVDGVTTNQVKRNPLEFDGDILCDSYLTEKEVGLH
jgi:hypothetical protein